MVHGILRIISQKRELRYFLSSTLLPQSQANLDSATEKTRGRKPCPSIAPLFPPVPHSHRAHPQAAHLRHRARKSAFIVTSTCLDKHATTQAKRRKEVGSDLLLPVPNSPRKTGIFAHGIQAIRTHPSTMAQHRQYSAPAIETLTTRIHGGLALDRLIGPSTHSIACDRCFKIIDVGELRYACLECYGWLSPEGQTATVRQVKMQRTKMVNGRGFTVETCHSQSATGYDLCSSCAKISSAHEETGHHFALWITR